MTSAAFGLGRAADSAPSAIFAADSELLFGEAAERRGLAQPERLVREFKRRIGDDVPIVVGDQRFAPEELYARMVAWVVDAVAEREGGQPCAISVTIPVTWGGHRSAQVAAALAREISTPVELISEPEAAARHYETTSPLEPGRAIAVYDLGGGTFDAVILRKEADGSVRLVGEAAGIADFGGADFDDIVLRHVIDEAGLSAADLTGDPASRVALASLRRECVEAKEALSFDSEAVVPVLVGVSQTTVRLTRSEFEGMIEDGVQRTIDVLGRSLDAAGMQASDLEAILLTGGSSRIPRIAQLLSERFDLPIAIDADPKAIVALGAARELADRRDAAAAAAADDDDFAGAPAALLIAGGAFGGAEAASAAEPVHRAQESAKQRWFGRRLGLTAAIAGGSMILASGIVLVGAAGLGNGSRAAGEDVQLVTNWLGLSEPKPEAPAADTAIVVTAPVVDTSRVETAPSLKAPTTHAKKPTARTDTTASPKAEAARPSRVPDPETPRTVPVPVTTPPADDPDDEPTTTDPDPEPSTGPDPIPTIDPDPTPTPDPDPTPTTDPEPDPTPTPTTDPEPDPTPTTDPDPGPTTEPDPGPTTEPDPGPTTEPDPGPTTEPDPGPTTEPDPGPTTEPDPGPTEPPVEGAE